MICDEIREELDTVCFLLLLDQCICLFNKPVYLLIRLSSTGQYYINTVYMFYASFCLFFLYNTVNWDILASGYFGGLLSKCGCLILVSLTLVLSKI